MVRAVFAVTTIGLTCGLLLVLTERFTAADIARNRDAEARALLEQLLQQPLPADTDLQAELFGNCDAWVMQRIEVVGYAGAIDLRVLWRPGDRLSMRVVSHRETPGIGDFIDHRRDPWITALDQKTAQSIAELDAVSGATITTRAIQRAARETLQRQQAYCYE